MRRPAARRIVEANKTGNTIAGVEMGPEALAIYGMTPIMRDGKSLAVVDIGVAFGKEFVDRAKQRFGVDLAVYNFNGNGFTKLASTFGDSVVATQEEMKAVARRHGTAPRRRARRPFCRALSRADQELCRPARGGDRGDQGHHRI